MLGVGEGFLFITLHLSLFLSSYAPFFQKMSESKSNLNAVVDYVNAYYPIMSDYVKTADWKWQEANRQYTAVHFNDDKDIGPLGWTSLLEMKRSERKDLSPAFQLAIDLEFSKVNWQNQTTNVRDVVKRIWTWPLNSYLSFIDVKDEDFNKAANIAAEKWSQASHPSFVLEQGHYWRVQIKGFNAMLFSQLESQLKTNPAFVHLHNLRANDETDHISLIPSDVLDKVRRSSNVTEVRLSEFMAEYKGAPVNDIQFKHCSHTVSLD